MENCGALGVPWQFTLVTIHHGSPGVLADCEQCSFFHHEASAVTFMESCSFENSMCSMTLCARGNASWERVSSAQGGPASDHTHQGALEGRSARTNK